MADEQKQRVDADQKEEARPTIPTTSESNLYTEDADTEFAMDTWMGAVFNPDANKPRGNISYDPVTRTERYAGEADPADGPRAAADTPTVNQIEADQAARSNRVADTAAERVDLKQADYETAAEIAPPLGDDNARDVRQERRGQRAGAPAEDRADAGTGLGWIGLGAAILSLFFLPYLMAPAGIVLGYLAFRRNARTLGTWAMIIGALAIVGALLIYPYFRAG
ncbi:DUF456 domain-containing protein [Brevibacillus humidisoli]|uniref:DUF456 domain-containing protein n=1 Tax=Brevibacillus humidisoli TaxID=2895522 RepID=UPI001E3A2842|nr:DUF456 domain-containing protein [Brevibacillus humidisoli]UFJ41591.1 DUF456 domain-containing protein [Brevibacillus humidisoli]